MALLREGLRDWTETGGTLAVPLYFSILAKACLLAGQFDDGLHAIEEGLKLASESEQHLATSALHRLRGELLLASGRGSIEEVEGAYLQALSVARGQEAKSHELRAAMSLARLWADGGERQRAHDLLAPVYGWFTEGFDTRDLVEAKALLGQLA
jgi:predicted ATPase